MTLSLKQIIQRSIAVYDTKIATITSVSKQIPYFKSGFSTKKNSDFEAIEAEFKAIKEHREVLQTMLNVILEEEAENS